MTEEYCLQVIPEKDIIKVNIMLRKDVTVNDYKYIIFTGTRNDCIDRLQNTLVIPLLKEKN